VSRHDKGRRVLRELTDLLTAHGVEAAYRSVPAARGSGSGWIALGPAAGQRGAGDAVWYLQAGSLVSGERLEQPHVVWGRRIEHRAAVADLAAAADAIAAQAAADVGRTASEDQPVEVRVAATREVE